MVFVPLLPEETRGMFRILSHLLVLFTSLAAMAQCPGGPLTITAARSHGAHAPASSSRGGTPYNDLCQNAVVQTLPPDGSVTITGDNTGATDTEDFGNPVSWEAFTMDTCATVTVSYCGTDPLFELVYSILIVGCPDFIANVQNSDTALCADGNVTVIYESLQAGTYYVPVLLIAGAEGPYTMTITSDVCDAPPPNDICANAEPLLVVQDCALGMVTGNNANAVINSAPPCATSASQFQDVWYRFDSGADTAVIITLDPGTIGDIGVEVRDSCAGGSVFCAVGDTSWTVAVEPGTNYRVRVFSNNDFGFGGTFGICITRPQGDCDGGTLVPVGGGTEVTVCAGGDPIQFTVETGAGIGTVLFILTDETDTIVLTTTNTTVDPGTLLPGEYHFWSVSYDGDLTGAEPGLPLGGIASTGVCLDLSDAPFIVNIEICEGLVYADAAGWNCTVITTADGPFVHWQGDGKPISLELFDVRGSLLTRWAFTVRPGQVFPAMPEGMPAAGLYLVRLTGEGDPPLVKRVFVH